MRRDQKAHHLHRKQGDLPLTTKVVVGFIELGYKPVIVIDTFSGDKLTRFLAELNSLNNGLDVRSFALVTAPEVLSTRIENRSADTFKDVDTCMKLNFEVIKYLLPLEKLIDNTNLTAAETADLILTQI